MEHGSRFLLIILGSALLLGALVVTFNPAYRQAFMAQIHHDPADSPIWESNREYYPDITLPAAGAAPSEDASHDAE